MGGGSSGQPKDWWDKAQIIGSVLGSVLVPIVVVIVGFLVSKSLKQPEMKSAVEQQRVQEAGFLLQVLKPLTSPNAKERQLAIAAIKRALPEDAASILEVVSNTDPSPDVRRVARENFKSMRGAAAGTTKQPTWQPSPAPVPPKPTPTFGEGISGDITYYSNRLPVPGVTVYFQGSFQGQRETTEAGRYRYETINSHRVLDKPLHIVPVKVGVDGNSIGILDAVVAFQAANGLLTLNHEQPLACDVDGDGAVTELDAKLILQRSLGSIMQFPVELTCGSNWAFVPTPLFPSENIHANEPALATWNCARGSIVIERPDQGPMYGMDFSAVMFGNCSGSWRPVSTQ